MAEIAKKHTDRLREIKKTIEEAREYWQKNNDTYHKFMRFVFKSSMTEQEIATLQDQGKPTIEFNILESFISRLRGEFAKQEPSLTVRAADGIPLSMLTPEFAETVDIVEAHIKSIFCDGSNDMFDYNIYSDLLGGGFSAAQVFTEYVNEESFEQNIYLQRVFDPTLTFFDPLARESHKGDGRYCGQIFPMPRELFEKEFGKEKTKNMTFTRNLAGFDWSFQNELEEVVLVAEYYEKKHVEKTICKLSNGHVVKEEEYEEIVKFYVENQYTEQPPIIVNKRKTTFTTIVRYRLCESCILDYKKTDYKYLPIIFFDGNSVYLKVDGTYTQMTRPYVYHAEGIQKLKNYAGQSLANELENQIQHKFKVAIEAIPEDYLEAYKNVQKASVLGYNAFMENNPDIPLPPPQEIARPPIPPEITNTFRATDEMTQVILGSFDNAQGVTQAPLSGVALARGAIQSNNASVPYVVGFIKGINRAAQIIVDLIPKYYRTPRTLPVINDDGERGFIEINKQGSLYMNFDPNSLHIKIEAGVNFAMQKEVALQTVISLSQANQGFAQFFNEEGLPILLDNIDIKGVDQLKVKAAQWMEKQKQQQAQASQQQQQQMQIQTQQQAMQLQAMQKEIQSPTEAQVGVMMVQQKAQYDAANISLKEREADTKFLETINKIRNADVENQLRKAEIDAEESRTAVNAAIDIGKHISKTVSNRE